MPPRELSADLRKVLGELKLGRLLPTLTERLRQARERNLDPEDVLHLVLGDEVQRRANQRVTVQAERAHLAPELVFEAWDTTARVTYDRRLLDDLRTLHEAELRRLATVDLLIVDDLALKALDVLETNDLYELVTARHRTASMVVTSNRSPEEWLPMLADPLHAQALVDRFTNNAYDLVVEGESYRKKQKPRPPADA